MDIELGIQNVARPVNFSTDESADNVSQAIAQAVADNATIDLTDDKGRRIIVPAKHSVTRSSAPKPSTPSASARCDHESRISGLGHYLKAAFVLLNHRYSGSTPR
mgnify:CR=1 FL=1